MDLEAHRCLSETRVFDSADQRTDGRAVLGKADDSKCPACGSVKRTRREHNTCFGVIAMAFPHWPETHPFQPKDEDHLRAWLLIECGHTDELDVNDLCEGNPAVIAAVGQFFCNNRKDFRLVNRGNRLIVKRPRTLQKDVIGVETYRKVAQAVYEIIAIETGLTVEDYKRQKQEENAKRRTTA